MNGRDAMSRGAKGGKGSKLNKDAGQHMVPGFLKGGSVKTVDARSYTDQNRTGASPHGTKIKLP